MATPVPSQPPRPQQLPQPHPPAPPPQRCPAPTPLVDALHARGQLRHELALHIPGHKRGRGTPPALRRLVPASALAFDVTELAGLDVLSCASGPIAEAQRLAAALWRADATRFLVSGSTGGVLAAVLGTCAAGDTLLLARNAHQSALAGAALAGATPAWLAPRLDAALGVAGAVTPAELDRAVRLALARGARPAAALVVSPTYFGELGDVAGLAAVAHAHGLPLLVDEAHGAHLGLHPSFPASALACGADVVVQSTHKTLGALTQAAVLHVRGGRVDLDRLDQALQMVQSSSPSYLLMASLDAARAQASDPAAFEPCLAAAAAARAGAGRVPGVAALTPPPARADPLRLTLGVEALGLDGPAAAAWLEAEAGVVLEMSTPRAVVAAFGIGSAAGDGDALVEGLWALSRARWDPGRAARCAAGTGPSEPSLTPPPLPEVVLAPREALARRTTAVPLVASLGRVAAEAVCPYPPGIPVLVPGERVDRATLRALRDAAAAGRRVTGCADASLRTLRVVEEG
ncbi:hypothetical protein ACKKBF_B21455 [Auxenochlorella protothecoides x Auxenochlorella symbiontica]